MTFDISKNVHFNHIEIVSKVLEQAVNNDLCITLLVAKYSFFVFGDRSIIDQVPSLFLISNYTTKLMYLGVILDDNLTFTPNHNIITAKCEGLFNKLARV